MKEPQTHLRVEDRRRNRGTIMDGVLISLMGAAALGLTVLGMAALVYAIGVTSQWELWVIAPTLLAGAASAWALTRSQAIRYLKPSEIAKRAE